jgi:ubiquinone/menaquinone biosynthesis C-methylase UbiE
MTTTTQAPPSPELFFDTMNAYQRTAALKAAIELDLFSAVGDGATAADVAARCHASERGVRILSDYLTIIGFMKKSSDGRYHLTPDTALFLVRRSPAYLGGSVGFLATPALVQRSDDLTTTVRRGTIDESRSTVAPDNPIWVEFARAMRPLVGPAADMIADVLNISSASGPMKVLDIAAGHGAFGIAIAARNPQAQIVAVDWPNVLQVAKENATAAAVQDRHHNLPGDAFRVDYGSGYHAALVTNFIHHFDEQTNVTLLRKIAAALEPGGKVAILEFVPNDDRITPHVPATFSMMMLATTAHGDAYTFKQIQTMLEAAGFHDVSQKSLAPMPQTLVLGVR